MIPRITSVVPMPDFMLRVIFDDGRAVVYDMREDIRSCPGYDGLLNERLFDSVQLDESRTCVYWTDHIDLPSDTIYEYGCPTT